MDRATAFGTASRGRHRGSPVLSLRSRPRSASRRLPPPPAADVGDYPGQGQGSRRLAASPLDVEHDDVHRARPVGRRDLVLLAFGQHGEVRAEVRARFRATCPSRRRQAAATPAVADLTTRGSKGRRRASVDEGDQNPQLVDGLVHGIDPLCAWPNWSCVRRRSIWAGGARKGRTNRGKPTCCLAPHSAGLGYR